MAEPKWVEAPGGYVHRYERSVPCGGGITEGVAERTPDGAWRAYTVYSRDMGLSGSLAKARRKIEPEGSLTKTPDGAWRTRKCWKRDLGLSGSLDAAMKKVEAEIAGR